MATLLFVLLFVVLGLAVLFVAMGSGRGGAKGKRRPAAERTKHRLALGAFVLALLGLGIGIPAAVIASVANRDSIPEENVSNLTEAEQKGRELFSQNCRNCHTLAAAEAVSQVGPNLDELRPPAALVLNAIEEGRARGNGNMAADLVEGEEAEQVARFVAKAVGQPVEE